MLDEEPEVAAQRLGVWFDEDEQEWRTNFPKADGEEDDLVTETGFFGDEDYERTLARPKKPRIWRRWHVRANPGSTPPPRPRCVVRRENRGVKGWAVRFCFAQRRRGSRDRSDY